MAHRSRVERPCQNCNHQTSKLELDLMKLTPLKFLITATTIFMATFLLFALCEGVASLISVGVYIVNHAHVAQERKFTQYDPLLGWVSIPNLLLENVYGKGRYVKINGQGFRNLKEFSPTIPSDTLRFLCSGDSFTFGHGVSNTDTWCARLANKIPHSEGINMGQCAYGLDQIYLWYKRDARTIKYDLHLVAIILDDIWRMQNASWHGYDKPVLRLKDDKLLVSNIPISRRSYFFPWLTTNLRLFGRLQIASLFPSFGSNSPKPVLSPLETSQVLYKIFDNLKELNQKRTSKLVVVLLPSLKRSAQITAVRKDLETLMDEKKIEFFDLHPDFDQLSKREIARLFSRNRHYSTQGNLFVADRIHERLLKLTDVRIKMNRKSKSVAKTQSQATMN